MPKFDLAADDTEFDVEFADDVDGYADGGLGLTD